MPNKTTQIIERMKSILNVQTQQDLANVLGTQRSTVSATIGRGQIPEAWLYKVAYQTQCRVEWLKTGELPKFLSEAVAEARAIYGVQILAGVEDLFEEWDNLSETQSRLLGSCIKNVIDGSGEDLDLMQAVIDTIHRKHEHDKKKKKPRRAQRP